MSEPTPRFQVPNGSTLTEIADLVIKELRRLEAQLTDARREAIARGEDQP